jgi:hypothetical protein
MKLQATIVISYRADSFGDAGDALDDLLQRARERENVEIDRISSLLRRAQLTAAPTRDDGEEHRSSGTQAPLAAASRDDR